MALKSATIGIGRRPAQTIPASSLTPSPAEHTEEIGNECGNIRSLLTIPAYAGEPGGDLLGFCRRWGQMVSPDTCGTAACLRNTFRHFACISPPGCVYKGNVHLKQRQSIGVKSSGLKPGRWRCKEGNCQSSDSCAQTVTEEERFAPRCSKAEVSGNSTATCQRQRQHGRKPGRFMNFNCPPDHRGGVDRGTR
jgi:hypothetical protein